jgi:hypothetical protein
MGKRDSGEQQNGREKNLLCRKRIAGKEVAIGEPIFYY